MPNSIGVFGPPKLQFLTFSLVSLPFAKSHTPFCSIRSGAALHSGDPAGTKTAYPGLQRALFQQCTTMGKVSDFSISRSAALASGATGM